VSRREEFLDQLAARLSGSDRARERLLDEVSGHLTDAIEAATDLGVGESEAERTAVEQFGDPAELATSWNMTQARRQRAGQRRAALIVVTTAAVTGVLAVTQHARGGSKETPPARHGSHAPEAGYTRWHAHQGRSPHRPPPGRGS
jgi:HAAS domain-containing protein